MTHKGKGKKGKGKQPVQTDGANDQPRASNVSTRTPSPGRKQSKATTGLVSSGRDTPLTPVTSRRKSGKQAAKLGMPSTVPEDDPPPDEHSPTIPKKAPTHRLRHWRRAACQWWPCRVCKSAYNRTTTSIRGFLTQELRDQVLALGFLIAVLCAGWTPSRPPTAASST
ncbi:hypothetical protein BDV95DRAFT_600760 [Massariosphaeria phaeospora]|uniref:Uncharacterized protein n=1 Tax=Massariosphaeria phaeospora TaxID=100035 RepID=A0A7C8MYH6_9PLEO|nr:hypothetical protein BDV95DRAFT_600760 [Massariosphaeria phaeospora]